MTASGVWTTGRPDRPRRSRCRRNPSARKAAMDDATIYALGTPTPSRAAPGALSVIRLSGPKAPDALVFLTEPRAFERVHSARDPALPEPRRMVVRTMLDRGTAVVSG